MNQKYFNVLEPVEIKGVRYEPKKSYRVTGSNFMVIRDMVEHRKAEFTAEEVNFTGIDAARKDTDAGTPEVGELA